MNLLTQVLDNHRHHDHYQDPKDCTDVRPARDQELHGGKTLALVAGDDLHFRDVRIGEEDGDADKEEGHDDGDDGEQDWPSQLGCD